MKKSSPVTKRASTGNTSDALILNYMRGKSPPALQSPRLGLRSFPLPLLRAKVSFYVILYIITVINYTNYIGNALLKAVISQTQSAFC